MVPAMMFGQNVFPQKQMVPRIFQMSSRNIIAEMEMVPETKLRQSRWLHTQDGYSSKGDSSKNILGGFQQ
jgi:hypothetical protein